VTGAFQAVAAQRSALAARLRAEGREEEAGIIEVAALIAADPALSEPAADAVRGGADPAAAVLESAERQAKIMEQLPTAALAARAADIRQVGAAVVDFLRTPRADSATVLPSPGSGDAPTPFILAREDVSPAELIELAEVSSADGGTLLAGAVSVAGGASSHAAIIARGLGVPMITGVDPAVLRAPSGQRATIDGGAGVLILGGQGGPEAPVKRGTPLTGHGPVRTADGTRITVLCNVASAAETRRGLAEGAAGVGLLRTEIPYLDAAGWPSLTRQREQLAPILGLLTGRTATVRLLDFSGDKIPPFLSPHGGAPDRDATVSEGAVPAGAGLARLLAHPTALYDQLRAILETGRDGKLAILIPMVRATAEIRRVRDVLATVVADLGAADLGAARAGTRVPPVGIMVELGATAEHADDFAREADFFSIGTNDLAGDVLGLSRRDPAAGPGLAADPRVLALIKGVADAGRKAGIGVSVCGDAAADPAVAPLLIGAGVRTLSVPAAAVGTVRSAISGLDTRTCAELTARALRRPDEPGTRG
jgi:phosphoenolpyruvate-protein kinase (PTS system EI component)